MKRLIFLQILSFVLSSCFTESAIVEKQSLLASLTVCPLDQILNESCQAKSNHIVTNSTGSHVTSWTNVGSGTTVIADIHTGFYENLQCRFSDSDLSAENILSGINVFGVTGTAVGSFKTSMASTALRDPGTKIVPNLADLNSTSSQLTLHQESHTYAGADLPTIGGFQYRDIPDMNQDDDGYQGTTCKYVPRPLNNCGVNQATIDLRIENCQQQNPASHSWNGTTQCNGGQGLWRLVSKTGLNNEVWRDERTGLLWSSVVSASANWCRATGNTQLTPLTIINSFNNSPGTTITGNGTIGGLTSGTSSNTETVTITFSDATTFAVTGTGGAGGCQGGAVIAGGLTTTAGSSATYSDANECTFTITQGTTNFAANDRFTLQSIANGTLSCAAGGPLQPASPISLCAEAAGLSGDVGEDWGAGTYFDSKGNMGQNSIPSVRWRLPNQDDFKIADTNGIRFVLPDMGLAGSARPVPDTSSGGLAGGFEWTTGLDSCHKSYGWYYNSYWGYQYVALRNVSYPVRCVGR